MSRNNIAFFAFVGVIVTALLLGLLLPSPSRTWIPNTRYVGQATAPATVTSTTNMIVRENALIGTSAWKISPGHEASTQIQVYASATSVSTGQMLQFYVSTQEEGTLYAMSIYRLGWYEGLGGRLMLAEVNQTGHAQGYYDATHHRLAGCNSCHVDRHTGLVEAHWQPSYTLIVPSNWITGVYLAKFIDVNGWQTYAPFDVQGNPSSTYVVVTSDTTYAAYNDWGGYSLYSFNSEETCCSPSAGMKVSFDRPYVEGDGSGHILAFELDAIHWLERQGYDLSYMSSTDLHENPRQLLQHRAYLSIGHDEYWTKEMRDGVEYARDHGVGLAFLGADAVYWQMRFEPDSAGIKDRTIVCYKVETRHNDLARDPLYGKDNTRVTTEWRDPLLHRPENGLIGIMYSGFENTSPGFPWRVKPTANSPFLKNTGLQAGQQYGCGLVGYEWDRIFDNGATPPGLEVLGTSPTRNNAGQTDTSNTTYYFAPSGAMVFASGSIYWTLALDSYRESVYKACASQGPEVSGMQKLMVRIMSELVINHRSHELA